MLAQPSRVRGHVLTGQRSGKSEFEVDIPQLRGIHGQGVHAFGFSRLGEHRLACVTLVSARNIRPTCS
jgi:hypothetical protein